jgi:hypothetical protein
MHFRGDQVFFARDSGLLCKGFQEIGIDCKAIMPGPPMETDQAEDLIRTEYRNLEDPEWWRALGGEGVVFYGWGSGKYLGIVRAIKKAGLFLVTHLDTAGILGLLNGPSVYAGTLWRTSIGEQKGWVSGIIRFCARLAYGSSVGLIRNDLSRSLHLKQADVIGAITPVAMERIRKVCRIYGGEELASRVKLIPHPNASYMEPHPEIPKERLVVAVGRWEDFRIKGTDLMLTTSRKILEKDHHVSMEIYGRATSGMEDWHKLLPERLRARVRLKGVCPNTEIMLALQRARVSLCTSLREGYHTVSAEAHCCGCSVVGPNVPEIPSMKWFAVGRFGRMAGRNPDALADAVVAELGDWDHGARNQDEIAGHWSRILHSPQVARTILGHYQNTINIR